jgi:hypothetical protein
MGALYRATNNGPLWPWPFSRWMHWTADIWPLWAVCGRAIVGAWFDCGRMGLSGSMGFYQQKQGFTVILECFGLYGIISFYYVPIHFSDYRIMYPCTFRLCRL